MNGSQSTNKYFLKNRHGQGFAKDQKGDIKEGQDMQSPGAFRSLLVLCKFKQSLSAVAGRSYRSLVVLSFSFINQQCFDTAYLPGSVLGTRVQ